eukprot:c16962_g1_i2.p1 GENE.c16962_g1_i2~~c16962_g1_i2.p1  ORF type:complete len:413 (+),score=62.67 c16962_g1_i2:485-1723(+)
MKALKESLEIKNFNHPPPGAIANEASQSHLEWLRSEVGCANALKAERQREVATLRDQIISLWELMGIKPTKTLEIRLSQSAEAVGLQLSTLTELKQTLRQLLHKKGEHEHRQREKIAQFEVDLIRLCSLWEEFSITCSERPAWASLVCTDVDDRVVYAESSATKLWSQDFHSQVLREISRVETVAAQRVDILIEKHRNELHRIWDRLKTPPALRIRDFPPIDQTVYNVEALDAFKKKLCERQAELEAKLPIIIELEKRQEFLDAVEKFELEASDPTRFRRSTSERFLTENRFRVKAAEKIRAVDLLIETKIRQWEDDHDQVFTYNGCCFLDELYKQQRTRGIIELAINRKSLAPEPNVDKIPLEVAGLRSGAAPTTRGPYSRALETARSSHLRAAAELGPSIRQPRIPTSHS